MKPQVLVTHMLPEAALETLRRTCEVHVDVTDRQLSVAELQHAVQDKDGVVCVITERIDAAVLGAGSQLKVVANVAVGYDNIDVAAATAGGVVVTNTPGVVTEATADLTWALLLSIARRIPESDRYVRSGQWQEWRLMFMLGSDVYGATLGIVGMGRIGQAVARRAKGFGMRVLYHNRHRLEAALETELGATWVEQGTLLHQADFVSLHVPLLAATTHLIGEAELRQMRPTAYLLNASRGPVVDEVALVRALQQGWIAGAALDVFEHEPYVPPELLAMDNVVLLPHLGSASVPVRTRMAVMAAENVLTVLRGERPPHVVNPEVYTRR